MTNTHRKICVKKSDYSVYFYSFSNGYLQRRIFSW